MSSVIAQLQQDALDRRIPVSDLLRRGLVVAHRLELADFQSWIEQELRGYGDQPTPSYRQFTGRVVALNPYRGWQPVQFESQRDRASHLRRRCVQSVAELESLIDGPDDGSDYHMPCRNDNDVSFGGVSISTPMSLVVSRTAIVGILDTVRTIVLNWSLKLEEHGIAGDGSTFSSPEKEAARHSPQNITNFYGPVYGSQVQQVNAQAMHIALIPAEDVAALEVFLNCFRAALPKLGLATVKAEAEAELQTIQSQLASPKPKASIINEGLRSLRTILEGAAGAAAGQLLIELTKLLPR